MIEFPDYWNEPVAQVFLCRDKVFLIPCIIHMVGMFGIFEEMSRNKLLH